MAASTSPIGSENGRAEYIVTEAGQYGLDAGAVLAVAAQEGLGGTIGDSGSSFGPFQMHVGGEYDAAVAAGAPAVPASGATAAQQQAAEAWANSPAGIDYALEQIAGVAKGQTGDTAITSIVYGFERPTNEPAEVARATAAYPSAHTAAQLAASGSGGLGKILGELKTDIISGPGDALIKATGGQHGSVGGPVNKALAVPNAVVSGAEALPSFLGKITSTSFLLRAGEVIGGAVLLLAGLYLLARSAGLAAATAASGSPGAPTPPVNWTAEEAAEAQRRAEAAFQAGQAAAPKQTVQAEGPRSSRRRTIREGAARARMSEEIPF